MTRIGGDVRERNHPGGFGDMPDAKFADIGIASLGPEYRHSEDWDWMKNYVPR